MDIFIFVSHIPIQSSNTEALKKEKLAEKENIKQLVQCLDRNEAAAQEARQRSLLEVKQTLEEQLLQPKNNALDKDGPLDLKNCGPSSLQRMDGEDHEYEMVSRKLSLLVLFSYEMYNITTYTVPLSTEKEVSAETSRPMVFRELG